MSAVDHTEPLPVTVIGGYLGAGKTTLVNHLLRHADGLRIAVLVNEFGALPIDADLIESRDGDVIALAGGCVCCSYGNDLIMAMLDLARLDPRPERVLLEASGVALPGAIAASIGLLAAYRVDGVIVLADGETVRDRAEDAYMADTVVSQLEEADLIVVNKTDLMSEAQQSALATWLAARFPDARHVNTDHGRLPLDVAFGPRPAPARRRTIASTHHDNPFAALETAVPDPVDPCRLAEALAAPELGLLRAKGFVRSHDGKFHEVQVVGRRFSTTPAPAERAVGLVCIAARDQLDDAAIAQAIAASTSPND